MLAIFRILMSLMFERMHSFVSGRAIIFLCLMATLPMGGAPLPLEPSHVLPGSSLANPTPPGASKLKPSPIITGAPEDHLPNIILITLDTTRADHLPCYGYRHPTSPFLCHLARQKGILFERAYTSAPLTLPAHATILTGLQPHEHGIVDNGLYRLPATVETLAERLKKRGYHTRAYVASAVLDRVYGLNQGFDVYNDDMFVGPESAFGYHERAASQIVEALEKDNPATWPRPLFLWVHFYDPHDPYVPPEPFRSRFSSPYDGEIAFTDAMIERMFTILRKADFGNPGTDVTIIVGDHGEDLGDHGEMRHGLLLTPATLHVPLIVIPPGEPHRKKVSSFFPTSCLHDLILHYVNPQKKTGFSALMDRCRKSALSITTYMPYHSFRWSPLIGLIRWPWLFIRGQREELYHLEADPSGSKNVIEAHRETSEALHQRVNEIWKRANLFNATKTPPELIENLEVLRSLGYAGQTVPDPPDDPFTLPHPGDRVHLYRQFLDAKNLIRDRRWAEARTVLARILKADPTNTLVLNNLATVYEALGEWSRAEQTLVKVTELLPDMDYPWVQLGAFLRRRGQFDRAIQAFKLALERNPRNAKAYLEWFHTLMQKRDITRARGLLYQAREAGINHPDLFMFLAIFARGDGKLDEARRYISEALSRNSNEPAYHLEQLRINCDARNENTQQCLQTLEHEYPLLRSLPDFWVIAARFFKRMNRPGEELFCWNQAASLPGLRPDHAKSLQRRRALLEAQNVRPIEPAFVH